MESQSSLGWFSQWLLVLNTFKCLFAFLSFFFFWELTAQYPPPLIFVWGGTVFLLFSFLNSLYILYTNLLLAVYLAKGFIYLFFYPFYRRLLQWVDRVLVGGGFTVQKLFNFMHPICYWSYFLPEQSESNSQIPSLCQYLNVYSSFFLKQFQSFSSCAEWGSLSVWSWDKELVSVCVSVFSFPVTFFENALFSPLCASGILVENGVAVVVWTLTRSSLLAYWSPVWGGGRVCQYHAALVTVALHHNLTSVVVTPPAVLFLLEITLIT